MPFLVLAGILCAAPMKVNKTLEPWNERDDTEMQLVIAGRGCDRHYGSRSPCLKAFYKLAPLSYYAECGASLKHE